MRSYLIDAFYSLGKNVNKAKGTQFEETQEGVVGDRLPELELDMNEEDLVKLSDTWERSWNDSTVKSDWTQHGDENEKYWKGEHYDRPDVEKSRAVKDNAIFEGLETYLPQVTRRNPEPMVSLAVGVEQSDPNQQFTSALQAELGEVADEIHLRLKLKDVARHHEVYLLGAAKASWDLDNDIPTIKVVRPTKLILDPKATIDADGYTGGRIGEHRSLPAWQIIALTEGERGAGETKKWLEEKVKSEMATEIGFIEWWTPDYMFWKCDTRVLMKHRNPHWNYDQKAPAAPEAPQAPEGQGPVGLPEQPPAPSGLPAMPNMPTAAPAAPPQPTPGVNHFKTRRMPYILMAVFTLGKQPVNVTSNIGQNLSNQDLINKRIRQIDKNADTANNGLVVSLERSGLTQQQSKGVTSALRNGGVVAIPAGSPQDAIWKPPLSELPSYVYTQLQDTRNRVRDLWGTRGSSPAGLTSESTVRGKILNKTMDTDRIGGGISEYLEQFADASYNWIVQLLYVYDDRFANAIAQGTPIPKIKVSVKEGSLLPKDSTTIANQAMELSSAGKMSMVDLYKRLDYPNPDELAANVWLEVNAPEVLYQDKRVQQVIQQRQAAAKGAERPPSESINFKDLPPEGKAQMAKQAGIDLHPEAIAAHDQANKPPTPQLSGPGSNAALTEAVAPSQ